MQKVYDRLKFRLEEFEKCVDIELPCRVNIIKDYNSNDRNYAFKIRKVFMINNSHNTIFFNDKEISMSKIV